MNMTPDNRRRRRAGALAAICGGGAASSISLVAAGHHTAGNVSHGLAWSDIAIAVVIVGLILTIVVSAVMALRCRS